MKVKHMVLDAQFAFKKMGDTTTAGLINISRVGSLEVWKISPVVSGTL